MGENNPSERDISAGEAIGSKFIPVGLWDAAEDGDIFASKIDGEKNSAVDHCVGTFWIFHQLCGISPILQPPPSSKINHTTISTKVGSGGHFFFLADGDDLHIAFQFENKFNTNYRITVVNFFR